MAHDTSNLDRLLVWRGRTSRRTYWLSVLGGFVAFVVAAAIHPVAGSVVLALLAVPALVLSVRRLHDAGMRGWYLLWGFVPYVGVVVNVVFLSLKGMARTNNFGPPPGRRTSAQPVAPTPSVPHRPTPAPAASAPSTARPTTRPTSGPTVPAPSLAQLRAVISARPNPPSVRSFDRTQVPQAPPSLAALRDEYERHRGAR